MHLGRKKSSSTNGLLVTAGFDPMMYLLFGGDSEGVINRALLGGGTIAMLAGLAFQALKNINRQSAGLLEIISSNEILPGQHLPNRSLTPANMNSLRYVVLDDSSSEAEVKQTSLEGGAMDTLKKALDLHIGLAAELD